MSAAGVPKSPRPLVIYDGLVQLNRVVDSRVRLASDLGPRERAAIERKPEWTGGPWPGGDARTDVAALATGLDKMLALLSFRSEVGHDDPRAIRRALDSRFPELAQAALAGGGSGHKRYPVQVTVDDDGNARWGFVTPAQGSEPPGLETADPDGDLRLLLQNLARADIATRRAGLGRQDGGV